MTKMLVLGASENTQLHAHGASQLWSQTWLQTGPHSSLVLKAQILVYYLGNLNWPEFSGKQ